MLVHCVEGGFHLGATAAEIEASVAQLAARGVTYVTLAHLFFRQVATNAPAIPFIPDWIYRLVFPQDRGVGLTALGEAAVRALLDQRVLIDLSHTSDATMEDTLELLDRARPRAAGAGALLARRLPLRQPGVQPSRRHGQEDRRAGRRDRPDLRQPPDPRRGPRPQAGRRSTTRWGCWSSTSTTSMTSPGRTATSGSAPTSTASSSPRSRGSRRCRTWRRSRLR